MTAMKKINHVMADPCASDWLKDALAKAVERDPVDAANEAEVLASLLRQRADERLNGGRKCHNGTTAS